MDKIREWSFPVGLGVVWIATAAYVLYQLAVMHTVVAPRAPLQEAPPAIVEVEAITANESLAASTAAADPDTPPVW
jgi:hypothetical protein